MTRPDLSAAGVLIACLGAVPVAGALEIRPSVAVGAVYTDNLRLNTDTATDPAVDDLVTRVDPRIDISHKSPRVDLRADYTYTYLRFSKADESDASFSAGSAALDLALIKGLLTLETRGDRSQQLIDPEASIGYSNLSIIDGRTDQTVLETSPHLQTKLGNVGVDLRYVLGTVTYDDPLIQDVDYQEAHTAVTSEEVNKGLSWGVFHDYQVYEYDSPPDNKSQLAYVSLTYGFRQAGDLFVFGAGGLENDYQDFTSGNLEDGAWKLGFRRVTTRTLVEASFGERSFGSTLNAKVRRALNKGSIEIAYREDPSAQEQLFEQRSTDPTPQPPGVPGNINRPGVGDRFVSRVLSATLLKELGRNRIEIIAFSEERDEILTREDPSIVQDSEKQTGIKGKAFRQLGPRTTLGVEAQFTKREFRDDNEDQLIFGRLVGTYALGRKLSLEGYLARHQQRKSNTTSDNYKEFQAGLSANYSFR